MSFNYTPLYCDTDSIAAQEQNKQRIKSLLNSCYGKQVMKYWQPTIIPQENKIMNREYIVVHTSAGRKASIIFKDAIDAIIPSNNDNSDYKTEIHTRGSGYLVSDSYESVVKQMFK